MKVLLLTHNPICTNNNMGKTFLTLFSKFEREELCQLYVHPAIPDVNACHAYYRITDKQVLKSLPFGTPGGEVDPAQIAEQIAKRESGSLPPPPPHGGASVSRHLMRDAMWKMSRWYSKDLVAWLDKEKPTCIFLAPGYAKFIYDIALKISKDYCLPIVTYICDDYYFVNRPNEFLNRWHLSSLQKKTDRLMARTKRLVVISEEIKEIYESHFDVKTHVVMTGASVQRVTDAKIQREIKTISYFGNLSAGRHTTLADIGRALDEINAAYGKQLMLHIYTSETSPDRLSVFNGISSVKLCGFVSGQAFEEAFAASDMLIHTESFREDDMDLVKHSVSTKIADSLAVGVPLLAYGPEGISSMKHLIRNECAVVATSREALRPALEKAFSDKAFLSHTVSRAVKTAEQYHDKERNSDKLKTIFAETEVQANERSSKKRT